MFTRARPRFQAHQYGGRHGSQGVSSDWRFGPIVWASTRKSGWRYIILSWEKVSDANIDLRESESVVWKLAGSSSLPFHYDLWLRCVLKKRTQDEPYEVSRLGESLKNIFGYYYHICESFLWILLWKSMNTRSTFIVQVRDNAPITKRS